LLRIKKTHIQGQHFTMVAALGEYWYIQMVAVSELYIMTFITNDSQAVNLYKLFNIPSDNSQALQMSFG
jgi:hypothetical protein